MARKCAALYHRTSTLDQDPTLARGELRGAAERLQLDVVLDVEETGSGARNDRPGLQRVLEAARRGKLDTILVWKLDRFGRSALDVLANIRALEDAGVRFICVSAARTPSGGLEETGAESARGRDHPASADAGRQISPPPPAPPRAAAAGR